MSQPVIFTYPSAFASGHFMQNQYPPPNGFQRPLYQTVKPRRMNRKRKLEDTDIEDSITQRDQNSEYLNFIKPSIKRRRTNQMNSLNNQQTLVLKHDLEENIYSNTLHKKHDNNNNNNEENRCESPYYHRVHPYLRNITNKEETPEHMIRKLNLNGFKMKNKQNETVNDWRNSIESQLNKARKQSSNIEELCKRISNSNGLGKDVLIAKLRKELPQQTFVQICELFESK